MLYFAYGSNINTQQMQVRMDNCGNCKFLGAAHLENYKLVFNVPDNHAVGAGYANVKKKKGSVVHGALYEVDETGFKLLDQCEYVPILYTREKVSVLFENNQTECFIYIGKKISKKMLLPTKRYLGRLLKGKEVLPKDYFDQLSKIETCLDPKFDSIKKETNEK